MSPAKRSSRSAKAAPVRVGAHQSSAGGLWKAVERAAAIGAEAVQLFGSSPRMWRKTKHTPEAYERFHAAREEASIGSAWLHAMYLINLAATDDQQWENSIDATAHALTVAHLAGAEGVVVHTGSHRNAGFEAALPRVTAALERVLEASEGDAILALETSAGQGGVIGSFEELGELLRAVPDERLRVCLDTCHVFAAGHDIASEAGMRATVEAFDSAIGLDRLAVLHANDSKSALGAKRDRHENIGDGEIGSEGFSVILREPAFAGKTFLLEVPGVDGKGPDAENIERLKRLRDG